MTDIKNYQIQEYLYVIFVSIFLLKFFPQTDFLISISFQPNADF